MNGSRPRQLGGIASLINGRLHTGNGKRLLVLRSIRVQFVTKCFGEDVVSVWWKGGLAQLFPSVKSPTS